MWSNLLMLAEEEGYVFNLRNGLLVLLIIGLLVGLKIYKSKRMT